jgi:hypothetical protein
MADIDSNLTTAQVKQIHSQRTAVKDRFYKDEEGVRYLGLEDGRLEEIHTIKGDVTGDLEEATVDTVGGKTSIEISNTVDQVIINTGDIATKIDRCQSIALTIALG